MESMGRRGIKKKGGGVNERREQEEKKNLYHWLIQNHWL